MEKKYISESRYKKTTREKANREKKGVKLKKKKKLKRKTKKLIRQVIILVIIILVAINIYNNEKTKNAEEKNYVKTETGELKPINYSSINIGINVENKTIAPITTKNLYIAELNKYLYRFLVKIDKEYNIKYDVLKDIEKISNKEYILSIKDNIKYDLDREISIHDVKNSIEQLKTLGKSTIYYDNVKNIKEIVVLENKKIKIILKEENLLFIYDLSFPILPIRKYNDKTKILQDFAPQELGNIYNVYQNDQSLIYERSKYSSRAYLQKINIEKRKSTETLISDFKENKINAFFTTSKNIENDLGKYEYDKRYIPTGQSVFMFGNSKSSKFANKDVRIALSYLINKQEIKKEVYKNMCVGIDIPYINYNIKYRYDKIAAKNILTSGGFEKKSGIYTKDKIVLSFRLLVNINNPELYKISKIIKNTMAENGIRIEIIEVDNYSYANFLNRGDYDLALMEVNLNENVNISFLDRFIYPSNDLKTINIKLSKEKKSKEIIKLFKEKMKIMQDEALCIGIISQTSCLISEKSLKGLEDIAYMNIFSDLQNIYLTK